MSDYSSDYSTPLHPPEIPLVAPTHPSSSSFLPTSSSSSSSSAVYPLPSDPSSLSTSSDYLDPASPSDSYQQLSSPPTDDEAQAAAIQTWTQRVKICFYAHMLTAIAVMGSNYKLSTVAGLLILFAFYLVAHFRKWRRKNFVWLFLLVVALNLVRDGVILYYEFLAGFEGREWWDFVLLTLLCVDAVIVTPCTCYACFWLHRSTAVSMVSV